MDTKSLLFGLIGFMLGGLVVSIAATSLGGGSGAGMSMSQMAASLEKKTGDEYDKAFIGYMINHHDSAVEMAKLSASRAKHQEIKDVSKAIIFSQEKEVLQMKQWQADWNYPATKNAMGH